MATLGLKRKVVMKKVNGSVQSRMHLARLNLSLHKSELSFSIMESISRLNAVVLHTVSFEDVVMAAGTFRYDIWIVDLESGLGKRFDVVEFCPVEVLYARLVYAHADSIVL